MKWKVEWFIIGLIVFWIIEIIMINSGPHEHARPFIEIPIPILFWIIGGIADRIYNHGN